MNLPKVKLEKFLPQPPTVHINKDLGNALLPFRENKNHEFNLTLPKVWKLILTEDSEKEIFGDLNPYRKACLPPLPFEMEKYYEKKLAFIENDQVQIYNEKTKVAESRIQQGIVKVSRAGYNVKLENAVSEDGRKAFLPNYYHKFVWIDIPENFKIKLTGECKRGDYYWSPQKFGGGMMDWQACEESNHTFLHHPVNHVKCCITPDN